MSDSDNRGEHRMNIDGNRVQKGKKRIRHNSEHKKTRAKIQRNSGKAYVTAKGKIIPEKTFKNLTCGCVKKCNNYVSEEERNGLFSRFWNLGDFSRQNTYISGLVQRVPVKQRRPNADTETSKGPKSVTYKYVLNIKTNSVVVCKKYFLDTFSISNGRLQRLLKKEESGKPPGEDLRGKQECVHKISDDALNVVREHIGLFPRFESHYTRAHNPNRKYLSPELNVRKLYNLYIQFCGDKGFQDKVVKEHIYRDIFNREFNLSFHSPRKDTCSRCDSYKMKISVLPEGPQKSELEREHQLHLRKAEKARSALKEDTEVSRELDSTIVLTFDLQKALAFPKLSTSNAYYKRNMYVYNLGIHHTVTGQAFMYIWDETVASRGSQEIGSCLMKHIELHCANIKHIIAYSDACTGQNRNIKLSLIWKAIVESPNNSVSKVDHKFMVSGHSFLPNDRDFGHIEKAAKPAVLYTKDDWIRIIRNTRKSKFQVYEMKQENFFSTKNLEQMVTKRKKNSDKEPFKWLLVQWLRFDSTPHVIWYKESLNDIVDFRRLDLKKSAKGRPRTSFSSVVLQPLYASPRPVTPAKKKDMIELLQWIPPIQHQFFLDLVIKEDAVDNGPLSDYGNSDAED